MNSSVCRCNCVLNENLRLSMLPNTVDFNLFETTAMKQNSLLNTKSINAFVTLAYYVTEPLI
jgi:hypothetical protein